MAGTGPGLGSRDAIAAHAKTLLDKAVADGKVAPDARAAVAAASVPSFSAGTVALDDNGRPVVPTEAAETPEIGSAGRIDPNATGALGTEAEAATEAAAAGAPVAAARGTDGKFVGDPAAAPKEPKKPKGGAAAAEAVAGDLLDEWADAEELIFEQDDGSKYKIRTPKGSAKQVERFNRRQASVDKASNYLGKYRQTLEPLVSSGQLDPIVPILQRALADPEFNEFVTQAYNRRLIGQPLTQAQANAQHVIAEPSPAQQNAPVPFTLPTIDDPYIADAITPALQPIMTELAQLRARNEQWENQQRTAQQQQAQAQAENNQRAGQVAAAHHDLARMYPAVYSGDIARDDATLQSVFRYARDGGYIQEYGIRGGIVLAAQKMQQDRADTGSPSAAMLEGVDRASLAAAAAQAAGARTVGGGSSAVTNSTKSKPLTAPTPRDATGRLKDKKVFMAEAQAYAAQKVAAS